MNAQVIEVNPFQSARWLNNWVKEQRSLSSETEIKLIVNETEIKSSNDSVAKYLHEEAIIHLLVQHHRSYYGGE